ncbi:DUF5696 domain-containing protein [uncultured Lutibacter sp.]|uniref:DUF5696 domain-containing protein n=1 Tax=uncultured Lutibacter sp. TaxID=437739 RepID=UPI002614D2BA|nr:DUF5696 domain-containing protein [uncultured Lutibacter sp.]
MKNLLFYLLFLTVTTGYTQTDKTSIENKSLKIEVNKENGCFTVLEKKSDYLWKSDPWKNSAAQLKLYTANKEEILIDLSTSKSISINVVSKIKIEILFKNPSTPKGKIINGIEVLTSLSFGKVGSDVIAKIDNVVIPKDYKANTLEYPLRSFYQKTEVERGLAAIPYIQGVVVPSYIYPMRNSKFGVFDDSMYEERKAVGEMGVERHGISMPWFGIEGEKSAAMTIIPENGSVKMKYILNYNNRDKYIAEYNKESTYPRILSVYPVWNLNKLSDKNFVTFHFMPNGTYVDMAKHYRKLAIEKGYFVSLKEKAKKAPRVNLMAGDIYLHLYGGYPHYVNFPGMAFTFNDVKEIVTDLHDNLNVERLWLNLWGVWDKYPPHHWPPNKEAGGTKELKNAVDLIKKYDYNVCCYTNWGCLLEHDPDYDYNLLAKNKDGSYIFKNRWAQTDPKRWVPTAMDVWTKANDEVGFNANYSDSGQDEELRKYLGDLGIPVSQERVGRTELSVKYWHRTEGMAPLNQKKDTQPFVEAPLFNLVYHDAMMTTNRWQSPDNDYDLNGDYSVRSLRNMLYGNEVMYVVPPYEYPGIRPMIKQAVKLMAPLHKETAFEELLSHKYLSVDKMVQRSTFANGTIVTVNMGLVDQKLPNGKYISGYGFLINHSNGKTTEGSFKVVMDMTTK